MKGKIHSGHMEVAVAALLNYRIYTIVPNVYWGLGLNHECDMLALDGNGRFTEIEIKISKADLKADFKKEHGHKSKYISRLVYAVPDFLLADAIQLCPAGTGIISVSYVKNYNNEKYGHCSARWVRQAKHKIVELPPASMVAKFMALGCMRIWSLKAHNNGGLKTEQNQDYIKEETV